MGRRLPTAQRRRRNRSAGSCVVDGALHPSEHGDPGIGRGVGKGEDQAKMGVVKGRVGGPRTLAPPPKQVGVDGRRRDVVGVVGKQLAPGDVGLERAEDGQGWRWVGRGNEQGELSYYLRA